MEMSQRIHFLYEILLKMLIFLRKWQNHFFGQNFLWQAKKKMKKIKLLENHAKNLFFFFFFKFLN